MLRDRARSAALLVPVVLVLVWLGEAWLVGATAIAVAVAGREAFRLLEAAGHPAFPALGIVVALVVALADSITILPGGAGLLLAAIGVVLVAAAALTRSDPRDGLASFATTVFGALYVGLLGFVPRLAAQGPDLGEGAALGSLGPERAWILLLFLGVWAFDTGAYAAGRRFGRRLFMTHISPRKTVEGVIGGTITVTIVSAIIVAGLGHAWPLGALLGPLIGAAAQIGDLAESMLKRAAGVKDSGTLIPGHGGLLDRVDSFLFAAPVVLLYVLVAFR